MESLPCVDLGSLTDVADIERLLEQTVAREAAVSAELQALAGDRSALDNKLQTFSVSQAKLTTALQETADLEARVSKTSQLAEKVSRQVRELDLAQSRLQDTITRVEDIIDLNQCSDVIDKAMQSEDYETAVTHMQRMLGVATESPDGGSNTAESTDGAVISKMSNVQKMLSKIVIEKYDAACAKSDEASVVRFVRLFGPLGMAKEGLQRYAQHCRQRLAEHVQMAQSTAMANGGMDAVPWTQLLASLLQTTAAMLENNARLIHDQLGGEVGLLSFASELNNECRSQAQGIVKKLADVRGIKDKVRMAKAARGQVPTIAEANGEVGVAVEAARALDPLLDEMVAVLQGTSQYDSFLASRVPGSKGRVSSVRHSFDDLAKDCVVINRHFMTQSTLKALVIDTEVKDEKTSSVVDDVFFIVHKCLRRAVFCGDHNITCAVVRQTSDILQTPYAAEISSRLSQSLSSKLSAVRASLAAPRAMGSAMGTGTGAGGSLSENKAFLTTLNNLQVSADYLQKVKGEVEKACRSAFSESQMVKVSKAFEGLGEVDRVLQEALQGGMQQLCGALTPRLKPMLDAFGTAPYELSEQEYAANEVNDPWVRSLLAQVDTQLAPLKGPLTESNLESFVALLIKVTTDRVEAMLMTKRFNQLGGLQLDRDVRTLVAHFSSISSGSVRDKFARITQIVTLLNLEKESELMDYWGDNSSNMTWRLSVAEVKQVLALRVEFRREAIAQLKL